MKNFWTENADEFSAIDMESRKIVLHPALAALIDQKAGVRILDYGCGDGSLVALLDKNCEITLFDISNDFLAAAKQKLAEYNPIIHSEPSIIPKQYFDYAISSLVLMTLPTKDEISQVLQRLYLSLRKNGTALIAITHPCFRTEPFSTFQTEYTQGRTFNYFKEGERFEVEITDPLSKETIRFHDYHWTLSIVVNLLTSCGFVVSNMYELPDKSVTQTYFNEKVSPYIIICCKKLE